MYYADKEAKDMYKNFIDFDNRHLQYSNWFTTRIDILQKRSKKNKWKKKRRL